MSKILLVSYNNDSYIHYFPLGLAYVAAKMRQQGYDVSVYSQDAYHLADSHLTEYLAKNNFDVVGVGMCAGYYQYERLLSIAQAVGDKAELWVGGHLVAPCADYFEKKLSQWCKVKIWQGEYDYARDVDLIGLPAWDLFPMDYYSLIRLPHSDNSDRCFPVLSGRGCPFRCNFCYRMEQGYRARDISAISYEIKELIERYHITYIDFADELLMINPERTIKIAEALKPFHIKWMCNGRLNYAEPSVLKVMKDAGCVFINYGIESVNNEVLRNMNKKLTFSTIRSGVEATLREGISPGLNMLWGNIGDRIDTLAASVDFLLKYDDQSQLRTIRPVTPYPGSPLYDYAVSKGLIKDAADFYENLHKNSDLASVQFTELSNEDFHKELCQANLRLIENYVYKKHLGIVTQASMLYYKGDTKFRGFRTT